MITANEKGEIKDSLGKTVLKQRGKLEFQKVYTAIREWFNANNYDTTEKDYTQTIRPHGDEYKLRIIGDKDVNSYVNFNIEINVFAPEIKKDTGNMRMSIEPSLILDYRGYFDKNKFTRFLKYVYNNYIIYRKIKTYYEAKVYIEYLDLCTKIKEAMNQYD
ncbi:hypothetical protein J4405_06165 [Candidatus Woesearchaeota archaeon]|nr:hypothetical protein [Candidatus Woesearchaeota archaeon]